MSLQPPSVPTSPAVLNSDTPDPELGTGECVKAQEITPPLNPSSSNPVSPSSSHSAAPEPKESEGAQVVSPVINDPVSQLPSSPTSPTPSPPVTPTPVTHCATCGTSLTNHSSQPPKDSEILHLVHRTGDFVVWVDHAIAIDWWTSDAYDAKGHTDLTKHNAVLNRAADLECIPHKHLEEEIRLNFKRMLGEAISRALKHDYINAESMLNRAQAFIRSRNEEITRYWQLNTAWVFSAIFFTTAIVIWSARAGCTTAFGSFSVPLALCAVTGGTGAILSMILRMGKYADANEAPLKLHICESASKIVAGIICGIAAAFALKAGLIIPPAIQAQSPIASFLLTALAAGLCERWIPSLISKIPNDTQPAKK